MAKTLPLNALVALSSKMRCKMIPLRCTLKDQIGFHLTSTAFLPTDLRAKMTNQGVLN